MRVHPFPFRTRQLSSLVPKILGWRRPGKIGRRQQKRDSHLTVSFFIYALLAGGCLQSPFWSFQPLSAVYAFQLSCVFARMRKTVLVKASVNLCRLSSLTESDPAAAGSRGVFYTHRRRNSAPENDSNKKPPAASAATAVFHIFQILLILLPA